MSLPSAPTATGLRALSFLVAFTALWAVIELIGYTISAPYDVTEIVGLRYVAHLLALALVCAPTGQLPRIASTRRLGLQIGRGFCMFVMPASFIMAVSSMSGGDLWALFWIAPLYVLVLARWVLKERVPAPLWVAGTLGYLGVLLMLRPDQRLLAGAALWPIVGALSFAIYVVLSRRLRDEPIATSLFYTGATALGCTLPLMIVRWQPIHPHDLVRIGAIGVVGLAALYCLDRALEYAEASVAAPVLYGVVGWEIAADAVLGHQLPPLLVIGGGALVLAVAALVFAPRVGWRPGHE